MTRIMLSDSSSEFYESPHDYGSLTVQGGADGRVFTPWGNYSTAFVECFPEGSFIRGEGSTIAEADDACWSKLLSHAACDHEWEPAGYRNGGGICKHCQGFGHKVFTAAELGLLCTVCSTPTFHTMTGDETSNELRCTTHDPKWPYFVGAMAAAKRHRKNPASESMRKRLDRVAFHGAPEDTEALEWAYINLDMTRAPRRQPQ